MINDIISELVAPHIAANIWIGEKQISQILSLEITQRHGHHNRLMLRFYHDQVQQPGTLSFDGAEKLLGQVAEIILYDRNGGDKDLRNLFVVTRVAFEHNALNEGILALEAIAPTGLLDAGPHYESFYRQSLATIAKTVAKPVESVKGSIQAKPTFTEPLSFICRYGESSWNFLKRLSAETGQWLYFNGKTLIFGEPESLQSRDLVYGQNCSKVSMQMQAKPVTAGYFDYDASGNEGLSQKGNSDTQIAFTDRGHAFKRSTAVFGAESFRYPSSLPAKSNVITQIGNNQAMMQSADMYVVTGESTLQELRVGMIANLKMARFGNSISHTPVRIISITHTLDASGHYSNAFEAINAQSPVPPPIDYAHPNTGTIPAEVTSNADESGQGRVQVKFLGWKQGHSMQQTDWIRILTPDAGSSDVVGQNRGYVFIPEVGDQVMVAFEHNNPDRPYVMGSIFHGGNGKGGGADNHTKTIITRSGHTIELDDDNDGTHIIIKDPGGNEIYLDTQGKNITITAPETMTLNAKNININADENITTNAGINIMTSAGTNMSSIAGAMMTNTAGASMHNTATLDFTMMATNIIGTAEDSLTHNASNNISKRGKSIEASASEEDFKIYSAKKVVNKSGENGNFA